MIYSTSKQMLLVLGGLSAMAVPVMAEEVISPELQAIIAKEKEDRKACKKQICQIFADKKAAPGTISCDVKKTWLQSEIEKTILRGKLDWPWAHARCTAKLNIDQQDLARLRSQPKSQMKLAKHDISCLLFQKNGGGEAYTVKLSIAPEVTFTGGKATAVTMNWSDIEAPALAKAAIWSATKLDNALGVLEGAMTRKINDFMFTKCKEVGIDIPEPK